MVFRGNVSDENGPAMTKCLIDYFCALLGMSKEDRATVIRSTLPPYTTHHEGWLTLESYVAWISTHEGVFLGDEPLAQEPPFQAKSADESTDKAA